MPPLRFVILHHDGIESPHFDLMFETAPNSALQTWRSQIWPIAQSALLERIDDHRSAYLEFEGALPNDRGQVRRVEAGICRIERLDDNTFLAITFLDSSMPSLHLRHVADNQWLAVASCGA